jgi:hypothetical protein
LTQVKLVGAGRGTIAIDLERYGFRRRISGLKVEITEANYRGLATLDQIVDYLAARQA